MGVFAYDFSARYETGQKNHSLTAYFDHSNIVDSLALPDHVIGRKFDDAGQVTNEYLSDFIYGQDGILTEYNFPSAGINTYTFAKFPSLVSYIDMESAGYPTITETHSFQYNSLDQISHSDHWSSGVGPNLYAYYDYFYDNNHKLIKKDHNVPDPDEEFHAQNCYEYLDNYRTRIDSYYSGITDLLLQTRTTNHYNERLQILTSQIDTYNTAGDITSSSLKTYSYTQNNKTDYIVTQNFTEGEWVNSSIAQYIYDDDNRVIEYRTGSWSAENEDWNITKKTIYDFNDDEQKLIVSFLKISGDEWVWDYFSNQTIFYESDLNEWQNAISAYHSYEVNQLEIDLHYITQEAVFPMLSEWYYEIEWDNGSITYQHLEYAADTTIGTSRPKIIVRSNTQYDKDTHTEVTHEYILEEGNKVYWWNKELEEYTMLYDYTAETDDEWEIKVGPEAITVHVDSIGLLEYEGETKKVLHISDAGNIFNGDIVVGYGHMTSFFPEKLMSRNANFIVDGLRCYWVSEALLYHNGEEDCDAVYNEIHNVNENESVGFAVYPNPANNVLFVETQNNAFLPDPTYHITNLMGQTLMTGILNVQMPQCDSPTTIDVSSLPAGMYFFNMGGQTVKFVVK